MDIFRKRLPARDEIVAVFGIVVFVVYSWSVRGFLYKVPSFLLYLRLDEIAAILLYMMAFALLESLAVTGGLVAAGFLLPGKWFKEGFAYKGFLVVAVAAVAVIRLQGSLTRKFPPMDMLLRGLGISAAVMIGLILLFGYIPGLRRALLFVQEQIGILVYLYVPLGLIGIIVVLVRNLL